MQHNARRQKTLGKAAERVHARKPVPTRGTPAKAFCRLARRAMRFWRPSALV